MERGVSKEVWSKGRVHRSYSVHALCEECRRYKEPLVSENDVQVQ